VPLIHQFDLSAAVRTEDYSDFGRATTPRYGAAWRPIKSVLLRGSYGEGFLAPQLYRTSEQSANVTLSAAVVAIVYVGQVDLSRGNAPIVGSLVQLSGGNPNLKPQLSESFTYGAVIDVPKVKGLAVSFDYYDNKFTNAFGSISSMMDRQRFAPETIYRGPKLATDPADWLGPITGYDGRIINIASSRSAGYSYGLRYQHPTAWGDFSLNVIGEKTLVREERILPNSALTASVNKRFVPDRVTASLFWSRAALEAGVTGVYGGKAWVESSNATLAPSRYTDDVMRWDFNAAYDFGRRTGFGAEGDAWWRRALHDTKLRVTIINVFDTEPPLNVNGSFSPLIIDPRLRRYVLDVTKSF
jgi:iron complex outermembrane receptor protein